MKKLQTEVKNLKEKNETKGITLIALVITIIVLLILAGVSIATLTGNNGVLNQANRAKTENEKATELEMVKLAVTSIDAGNLNKKEYNSAELQEEMDRVAGNEKTEVSGEGTLTVLFKDTKNMYYVMSNGNVGKMTDPNIFKYTAEGYITGVKEEYIEAETERRSAYLYPKAKYASLNNNIKLAAFKDPEIIYYLKEEVGTELFIPSEINGTKIKGISDRAFTTIYNLTGVTIPGSIESIGNEAFFACIELMKVNLSEDIKSLGASAFYNCFALDEIEIPDTVIEIGEYCFYQIGMNEIFIPARVQDIGAHAFPYFDKIYCEVDSRPEGWDVDWNRGGAGFEPSNTEWGVKR